MTACLALCRDYSRNDVAVVSLADSKVAAADSAAFPNAVPPGNARASGVDKFFENIKPLSDLVCAIVDAARNRIGKLFDLDKIFDFGNLINQEILAPAEEKEKLKSVEQYSLIQNTSSATETQNVVLTPEVVEPPSSEEKIHSLAEEAQAAKKAQAACNSQVRDSQNRALEKEWEDTMFGGPSEDDMKNFVKRLCLAPEEIPTWNYV